MYILPSGFTGNNVDLIEFDAFKSLCYSLQGLGLIQVIELYKYEYPNNYYNALISDSVEKFNFYVNCYTSVCGFAKICDEETVFIDKPQIEIAIIELSQKYNIISSYSLNSNAEICNLKQLNKFEKNEVKNWFPQTIGGLLFSDYFD